MELTPADHVAYYRSGFLIHGDSKAHPGKRVASEGCIILAPHLRKVILHSEDRELIVEP
jgi:hypothetical protein